MRTEVDTGCLRLFAEVSEGVARATWALLGADAALAQEVISADATIDQEAAALEGLVWEQLGHGAPGVDEMRQAFGVLMVLSELERSADLAEHVAQRALRGVGSAMTPAARGIVQRMSEVAVEMWRSAADGYAEGTLAGDDLHEADEELDILHERLTTEVASGSMEPAVAQEVALVARFYERIGDHAVNIGRRLADLPSNGAAGEPSDA